MHPREARSASVAASHMMANHPVERTRLGGPLTGGVRRIGDVGTLSGHGGRVPKSPTGPAEVRVPARQLASLRLRPRSRNPVILCERKGGGARRYPHRWLNLEA